jgi:hypothetical protein
VEIEGTDEPYARGLWLRGAKMKLPEIELTPEQSEDRTTLQLLLALDQALKDLQDSGSR